MHQTFDRDGRSFVRDFRPYGWGGREFYGYVPFHHFDSWYYGWAYGRWAAPVAYNWWWAGNPWCGFYGYYFQPYPTYYGPSYWLTDYVLAELLQEQYQIAAANSEAQAQYQANQQAMLDQEMKDQLRAQVEENLRNQQTQQPVNVGNALNDLKHIYVVSQDLNASYADQTDEAACALTGGDLFRLTAVPSASDQVAVAQVVTSKQGSCKAGSRVYISIEQLATFENDFNEKLDDGLDKMKTAFPGEMPGQVNEQQGSEQLPPTRF